MATVTHATVYTNTNLNTTSYTSGSFTPVVDDLLLVFVAATTTAIDAATLTGSTGTTFTRIVTATKATSADRLYAFIADSKSTATLQTVTFTSTGDATSGVIIEIIRLAGIPKSGGIGVIKQYTSLSNQTAGTPTFTFTNPVQLYNITLGFVMTGTNSTTVITPPTSWAEGNETGYNTPATGGEYVYRNSGFSGSTITWGNATTTGFGVIGLEINTGITGISTDKELNTFSGTATGSNLYNGITITWVEIDGSVVSSSGTSSKTITTITGSATGLSQRIYISWLEFEGGASSSGTSSKTITITGNATAQTQRMGSSNNKTIATVSGTASGALGTPQVVITWLEIEQSVDVINGTSNNKTITNVSGEATGLSQRIYISWLEFESGVSSTGNSEEIISIAGTSIGSNPTALRTGTSNRTITFTGIASGNHIKLEISWLGIENFLQRLGSSSQTLATITGNATGGYPHIIISWLKIEDSIIGISDNKTITTITGSATGAHLNRVGTSTKTITFTGTAVGRLISRVGISSKQVTSISGTARGKVTVRGTSNKTFGGLIAVPPKFDFSLRRYISPVRTKSFASSERNSIYISAERNSAYSSEERNSAYNSIVRTVVYTTPTRIGT